MKYTSAVICSASAASALQLGGAIAPSSQVVASGATRAAAARMAVDDKVRRPHAHCPRHGYMTSIARIASCFRVRHVTACDPPPPLVASTYMFLSLYVRDRLFAPPPPQVEVKQYFNNEGFDRWSRIYSEDGEVNSVQLDIRNGHAITVDKVLGWVDADGTAAKGETFCDAGCGVGSLSLPLAKRGATVVASDISAAMVEEATKRAETAGLSDRATFSTSDLEAIEGKYDTVTCIDVMIHYPQDKMAQMVQGLASKADKRLIISFAPDTWYYTFLKKVGELFPGPSKTTRAYLHTEEAVVKALSDAGFELSRTEMTGTSFYFSRLLEAVKKEA